MAALPSQDLDNICELTKHLWDEVRDSKFFITGGTGFFGAWLLESFLRANQQYQLNAEALVLSRDPEAFLSKCPHLRGISNLRFHKGNVRSFKFPTGNYDYVIHAATEASAKKSAEEPLEMLSTILEGTARTLAFAKQCNARKFLLTSSGAIYGPQPPHISHIDESFMGAPDCLDPASVYAEGKRAAELMCVLYSHYFEVKIARCFAFVGPHLPLDAHFAIGNFIRNALGRGPIIVQGDGTPRRSYLYASDLAVWLWTILFRGVSARPYNVGSSQDLCIKELAELVNSTLGNHSAVEIHGSRKPNTGIVQYVPCVDRAEKELGLRLTINLPAAIRKTADWCLGRARATAVE